MSRGTKETVKDNISYLNSVLNPIFEQLTLQILVKKPNDVVDFIINWLLENADGYNTATIKKLMNASAPQPQQNRASVRIVEAPRPSVNSQRLSQITAVRAEPRFSVKEQQQQLQQQQVTPPAKSKKNPDDSFTSESDEDEDEEVGELPPISQSKLMKARQSVSAEVYGKINKKQAYKPKVVIKSKKQKEKIRSRLDQTFMFSALDDKEKDIVIDAMEELEFNAGEYVIRQGEQGNELYVVDVGNLECTRATEGGAPKLLKTYYPGDSFGELALLYNAPRAATIRAKTNCVLYSLDRECFNHIVKGAAMRKREHYDAVLQKVSLLQSVDPYERSQIADVVKSVKFKKGEYIIRQGETGNTFYMVEDGTAVATKLSQSGNEEEVFKYKTGDYFGELALLKDAPRAANIIATSDISLVFIERDSFKRILGPLDEILTRNIEQYR